MLKKILLPLWILGGILLLLYSFTQVDLSLTLSRASFIQDIQKGFQYIGWFNRPLSTYLYIGVISYLFIMYLLTLMLVHKKELSLKAIWIVIVSLAIILVPSYNAFSYDLFNYIFDARIVSHYNLSPYEFKPLDFPQDAMLSFMRSTHRAYPYGPSWLGLTVPLTYIASEIFVISLMLFKLMSAAAFLGTSYFIKKTSQALKLKNVPLSLVLFALNPLVLIEGLVSAHNETIMMFFAVLATYLFVSSKKTLSFITLLISIGIKYSTIVILPVFILKMFYKKLKNEHFIGLLLAATIFAVIATSLASGPNKNPEFQPWYLLLVAPFVAMYEKKIGRIIFTVLSFTVLFSYIPYLFMGQWPENIVDIKNIIVLMGLFLGIAIYYLQKLRRA